MTAETLSRDLVVALWRHNHDELTALLQRPEPGAPFAIDTATGFSPFWLAGHLLAGCANVLALLGGRHIRTSEDVHDFIPGSDPAAVTEGDWAALIADLERAHKEVIAAIAWLGPSRLGDAAVNETQPMGLMLQGCGQHDAMHIGNLQALLR